MYEYTLLLIHVFLGRTTSQGFIEGRRGKVLVIMDSIKKLQVI